MSIFLLLEMLLDMLRIKALQAVGFKFETIVKFIEVLDKIVYSLGLLLFLGEGDLQDGAYQSSHLRGICVLYLLLKDQTCGFQGSIHGNLA